MSVSPTQAASLSPFLDQVLRDFDQYSDYVAIDVSSSSYRGRVVIENDDLYYFLEQTRHLDKRAYRELIAAKIRSGEALDIGNASLKEWHFHDVSAVKAVTDNAKKGKDQFITAYFNGRVLKDGIADVARWAVVNQLFEWRMASFIDDESGYLVLSRSTVQHPGHDR